MCVCVCVCPAACCRTYTTYHPKIWRGLLISPWLGTEPGGDPKCWPRGTRYSDPVWKNPEGLRIGRGPANKSCSSGWVCIAKFYLRGSTLPNGGVCFENWAGASKQKLLLGVGLCLKILFVGGSPKARWVFRSICTGLFHNEIVT
jgi:hypothetical protein